jgi:hypothetical protein
MLSSAGSSPAVPQNGAKPQSGAANRVNGKSLSLQFPLADRIGAVGMIRRATM